MSDGQWIERGTLDLWEERHRTQQARIAELEAALTGMLHVWDEVCKAIPPLTQQPEAVQARALIEKEKK